jgi:hypothetical protein
MKKIEDQMDFSNYPPEHFLYNNHSVKIGKFKDETNSVPPSKFVALKSKIYSLQCEGGDHIKAKGTPRTVTKSYNHQMYVDILKNASTHEAQFTAIRSENRRIYLKNQTRLSLNAYDDKRYLLDDGIRSLAYGHWKIKKKKSANAESDEDSRQ